MVDNCPASHPEPEVLLAYAVGGLDEAASVLVATHLALCPQCRTDVDRFEAIGGALTQGLEPAPMTPGALDAVLARLDDPAVENDVPAPRFRHDEETLLTVPSPLRDYIGGNLSSLPWKWRGPAVRELPLTIGSGSARATLIRVRPGAAVPAHTHTGVETTLVLRGAFVDEVGRFARGDVATATSDLDHRPRATPEDECICFAVVEGPLKLTGPIGRLLNPLMRI